MMLFGLSGRLRQTIQVGLLAGCCAMGYARAGDVADKVVLSDQGVSISQAELAQTIRYWSPDMRQAAATDPAARHELLNLTLAGKKIARLATDWSAAKEPEWYWKQQLGIRNLQRRLVIERYLQELEIPDMQALAEERYATHKETFAKVPEQRYSSHILIKCLPGVCDRNEKRPIAEQLLARLQQGENFASLVETHSDDEGTRRQGGKFDQWMTISEPGVVARYREGLFSIAEVGGYSGVVESRFGFHIIRLDDLRESYIKPYAEVKADIIAGLENDYRKQSARAFDQRFRLSDQAIVDEALAEELFAPYHREQTRDVEEKPAS